MRASPAAAAGLLAGEYATGKPQLHELVVDTVEVAAEGRRLPPLK